MRLKKGLIKIWRDLAKNKTKQIKNKPQNKGKRLCTRRKSVLMMGLWRWANAKSTFLSANVLEVRYKTTHFLIYTESLVGQISCKLASQYQYKSGPNCDALAKSLSRVLTCTGLSV